MQPNWAKIIGEMIADHELAGRKQIEPLVARIAELEARPIQKEVEIVAGAAGLPGDAGPPGPSGPPGPKGDAGELGFVPSELAEQIKMAIHLLHESPPILQQNAPPLRAASPLPQRVIRRIERNENGYTLIDDEQPA